MTCRRGSFSVQLHRRRIRFVCVLVSVVLLPGVVVLSSASHPSATQQLKLYIVSLHPSATQQLKLYIVSSHPSATQQLKLYIVSLQLVVVIA